MAAPQGKASGGRWDAGIGYPAISPCSLPRVAPRRYGPRPQSKCAATEEVGCSPVSLQLLPMINGNADQRRRRTASGPCMKCGSVQRLGTAGGGVERTATHCGATEALSASQTAPQPPLAGTTTWLSRLCTPAGRPAPAEGQQTNPQLHQQVGRGTELAGKCCSGVGGERHRRRSPASVHCCRPRCTNPCPLPS